MVDSSLGESLKEDLIFVDDYATVVALNKEEKR